MDASLNRPARVARPARRVLTVLGIALWGMLATAGPALASASGDDGEAVTAPLSKAHVLLVYVGLPALIIATIWLLASIPSMLRAPRYRPGVSWWAAPVWFSGPGDEGAASAATTTAAPAGGSDDSRGGTSARW